MSFDEQQILESCRQIWQNTLGLDLTAPSGDGENSEDTLSSYVKISGDWKGAILLECAESVTRHASAMLFVGAKISHLTHLPQGAPERERRVVAMVERMDEEGFGNCSNHYECEAACPKGISVDTIALLNREYLRASVCGTSEG